MFPMMTPMDAISLSLRAGMIFGQTQTLWISRMMEMQGLWAGYPRLAVTGVSAPGAEAEPEVDAEEAAAVVPAPLTELRVEALAAMEPELPPTVAAQEPAAPAETLPEEVAAAVFEMAPESAAEIAPPGPVAAPAIETVPVPTLAPNVAANPKRAKKPAPRAE